MSAIARRRLPTTSGLASLRKPMCVSLICTKVIAFVAAAARLPAFVAPSARGTPPETRPDDSGTGPGGKTAQGSPAGGIVARASGVVRVHLGLLAVMAGTSVPGLD